MNPRTRSREPDRRQQGGWSQPVTIRLAGPRDAAAIARVAGRDTRAVPPPPHLVAIRAEEIEAVLSLSSGEAIADPFRPTARLVELLRCHADGIPLAAPREPRARPLGHDRRALEPRLAGGRP